MSYTPYQMARQSMAWSDVMKFEWY